MNNTTFADEEELIFQSGAGGGPPRIVVYGAEKIGKTTFGASAPEEIFICTEDGAEHVGPARMPLAKSYEQVVDQVTQLRIRKHNRQTLVIDTLDWLEKLIHRKVCSESRVASIELAAGGFGKGYVRAAEILFEFLTEYLDGLRAARGMGIILLSHDKVEKVEEPGTPAYDRSAPRLDKRAIPYVKDWCDAIGFAYRRVRVAEDEAAKGTRNIVHAVGAERHLCVSGLKPFCVSGNRYGITEDLPLSWQAFAEKAFATK